MRASALVSRVDIPGKLVRLTFSVEIPISTGPNARTFCSWNSHSTAGERNHFHTGSLGPSNGFDKGFPKCHETEVCTCCGKFRTLKGTPSALKKITHLNRASPCC